MYYGELKKCDIANGEGVRVSLFVSGCRNRCKDCFQPETWDFCFGKPFTEDTEREIFAELDKSYIAGLSLLGGDPFAIYLAEPASDFIASATTLTIFLLFYKRTLNRPAD